MTDLRSAAEALYKAGRWQLDGMPDEAQAKLWEDLRDALWPPRITYSYFSQNDGDGLRCYGGEHLHPLPPCAERKTWKGVVKITRRNGHITSLEIIR